MWILWQGKNCRQFCLLILVNWSVRLSSRRGGDKKGWMKVSLFQPAASITLSEYINIWSNIQVIIYPLCRKWEFKNLQFLPEQQNDGNFCKEPVIFHRLVLHKTLIFHVKIVETCTIYMFWPFLYTFRLYIACSKFFTLFKTIFCSLCMYIKVISIMFWI